MTRNQCGNIAHGLRIGPGPEYSDSNMSRRLTTPGAVNEPIQLLDYPITRLPDPFRVRKYCIAGVTISESTIEIRMPPITAIASG